MDMSGQLHALQERAPGAHRIGGWVGPRAGLNTVEKKKIPSPRRDSKPDHPTVQPVSNRYTNWHVSFVILYQNSVFGWAATIWTLYLSKSKSKVVPVFQLSTIPWRRIVEWRYSSTHSLTSVLDGEWLASRPGRFIPGKEPLVPIG
jgi:hypothetical protein